MEVNKEEYKESASSAFDSITSPSSSIRIFVNSKNSCEQLCSAAADPGFSKGGA